MYPPCQVCLNDGILCTDLGPCNRGNLHDLPEHPDQPGQHVAKLLHPLVRRLPHLEGDQPRAYTLELYVAVPSERACINWVLSEGMHPRPWQGGCRLLKKPSGIFSLRLNQCHAHCSKQVFFHLTCYTIQSSYISTIALNQVFKFTVCSCNGAVETDSCSAMGGVCHTLTDGYFSLRC